MYLSVYIGEPGITCYIITQTVLIILLLEILLKNPYKFLCPPQQYTRWTGELSPNTSRVKNGDNSPTFCFSSW